MSNNYESLSHAYIMKRFLYSTVPQMTPSERPFPMGKETGQALNYRLSNSFVNKKKLLH